MELLNRCFTPYSAIRWKILALSFALGCGVVLVGCERKEEEPEISASNSSQSQTGPPGQAQARPQGAEMEKDLEKARKDLETVQQERDKLTEQYKANKAKIGGLGILLHSSIEETNKLKADLENVRTERDTLKGDLSKTSQSLSKTRGELTAVTQDRDKLKGNLSKTSESLNKTKAALTTVTQEGKKLKGDLSKTSGSLKKTRDALVTIGAERDKLQADLSEISESLSKSQAALLTIGSERDKLKGDLSKTSELLNNTRSDLTAVTQERDKLQADLSKASETLTNNLTELKNAAEETAKLRADVTERAEIIAVLEGQVAKYLAAIDELKKRIEEPAAAPTLVGGIRATIDTNEPIEHVWAIQRRAAAITTSKEKVHDTGIYAIPYAGKVVAKEIVIENLPVPGLYDLKLQTQSGGIVSGWDPNVPESDYVDDLPLKKEARQKIFEKLSAEDFSAFSDGMWVLDIQGNIQNAAALVMKLRTRPFVGGDYKPGEWVWRIERWQWEDPDEHTWVPYRKRPFYALTRERLVQKQLLAKRILLARHLGGIILKQGRPSVDLGTVKIPRPVPGVFAVNPDGTRIRPVVLKGLDKQYWPVLSQIAKPENEQAGGAK
ncbi:MAG: hypothetical protein KAY65_07635 [Planctomycetes bacterium]|nr:hypothetical protein [Planctomycetota bacterium]